MISMISHTKKKGGKRKATSNKPTHIRNIEKRINFIDVKYYFIYSGTRLQ